MRPHDLLRRELALLKNLVMSSAALALLSSTALAADLPSRRAPPVYAPPPPAAFSWTGWEAGLHSAYTFASNNHVSTAGNDPVTAATVGAGIRPSYLGTEKDGSSNVGVGFGYNYQFANSGIVVGFSADADWVDLHKNAFDYVGLAANTLSVYHQRLDWLGTANGKLGYAFDRFLVYGTGGLAFGDPGYGASFFGPGGVGLQYVGGNNGQLRAGYNFGGGVEYAIPNDSFLNSFSIEHYIGLDKLIGPYTTTIKVEYIHYNLGGETITAGGVNGFPGSYSVHYHSEGNQVRAGLLYTFNSTAAPVVARY
jgi:outer membrane immunogenic protein